MSKPILRAGGSYPANSPLPIITQIQLDDVWSMGDILPISWGTIDLHGSDHRGVVVDFEIRSR